MAGVVTLIRLILRRDRVKLPLWVGGFVLSLIAMIPLLNRTYGDAESLEAMYATFSASPAGLFMTGPMDEPTFGAFMTIETLLWWGMAIAFMNTLLIVRHTRHNEEIGAQELLLSGRVHRASGLLAALIVAMIVNGLIVLGLGFGMQLVDVTWATDQSWLFAGAMGVFGLTWAAVAAVVVQLVESGRSANGMLAGLIGLGFVLRGVGDFMGEVDAVGLHQPAWPSALSLFGWLQATRPLTESNWLPLIVLIGLSVMAAGLGFILLHKRDVGEGLLPARQGQARASRFLATNFGLTWHIQKNIFIGWLTGVLVMVGTIGVLAPQMGDIFESSDSMRQTIETIGGSGALVPAFMSAMLAITALLVFAYAVHGLSRLRSEEVSGHLESLLATKLSRIRWLGTHVLVVLLGGLVMLALSGTVLAALTNILSDYNLDIGQYGAAGLAYLPVMLAFVAIYLLLFGLLPRLANGVVWFYYGFLATATWLGSILQLNQAIMNLSIMEHVAATPAETILWSPIWIILAGAAVVASVGVYIYRRRDIKN